MIRRKELSPIEDAEPIVSVVIVTYCSAPELPDCLESVLAQSVPVEIFLIDNGSTDGTPKMIEDFAAKYTNIRVTLNQRGIGLAAANNQPMGHMCGKYVLILNPDTILKPDTLSRMVDFLETNQDVGAVGPKNLYQNGSPHVSFHKSWGLMHVLIWRVLPYRFVRRTYDRFSSYRQQDVLFVSGSCLLTIRTVYEQIGGYDPEYFLTVEDVCDLCTRIRDCGYRIVYYPKAEMIHLGSRSANRSKELTVWQGYRGTVYHFLKHKGKAQAVAVTSILLVGVAVKTAIASFTSLFRPSYRAIASMHFRILSQLLTRNPCWSMKERSATGLR